MIPLTSPKHVDLHGMSRTFISYFISTQMQTQKLTSLKLKNTSNFNRVFDNEGVRFTKISRRHKR